MQSDATFSNLFTRNPDNKINFEKELEYETLSKRMMTIWTNFAKTGYVQTKLIARGVWNHFVNPRLGLQKVTKWQYIKIKRLRNDEKY